MSILQKGHNQNDNKRLAMDFVLRQYKATPIDKGTVQIEGLGKCHVAAYTAKDGALIFTTTSQTNTQYGDAEWHHDDYIILFRDTFDGRCLVYCCKTKPFVEKNYLGIVIWDDVEELSQPITGSDERIAEFTDAQVRAVLDGEGE